ncbi:uncharacterized protein LOC117892739 [Drosophila subobscura]|uniref:uncharacterized protein LOC117892739 n=1 Tax=Drosophila subobscura TaxID=7241 RepID=UPI00155A2262|nr:uncharacterized protein LOC117892739 [Drosophila subobscura]
MNRIWSQFRGGCILRGNLIKFNNNMTSQIETNLKFEDLLTERQQLAALTRMLTCKVRGLERMVSDLTRDIKRLEFDRNLEIEEKEKEKEQAKATAKQSIESSATSPPAATAEKKKITQCR